MFSWSYSKNKSGTFRDHGVHLWMLLLLQFNKASMVVELWKHR